MLYDLVKKHSLYIFPSGIPPWYNISFRASAEMTHIIRYEIPGISEYLLILQYSSRCELPKGPISYYTISNQEYIDGLVQDCSNPFANAMELLHLALSHWYGLTNSFVSLGYSWNYTPDTHQTYFSHQIYILHRKDCAGKDWWSLTHIETINVMLFQLPIWLIKNPDSRCFCEKHFNAWYIYI